MSNINFTFQTANFNDGNFSLAIDTHKHLQLYQHVTVFFYVISNVFNSLSRHKSDLIILLLLLLSIFIKFHKYLINTNNNVCRENCLNVIIKMRSRKQQKLES